MNVKSHVEDSPEPQFEGPWSRYWTLAKPQFGKKSPHIFSDPSNFIICKCIHFNSLTVECPTVPLWYK